MLIGASDPDAMLAFTKQCTQNQSRSPPTPPSSWPGWTASQVRALVDGAAYLFCNEYEATLTEHKTGWTSGQILNDRVGVRVTTLGPDGARVDQAGQPPMLVRPVPGSAESEPTGAGDAFRAGFLAAVGWGLSPGAGRPARQSSPSTCWRPPAPRSTS